MACLLQGCKQNTSAENDGEMDSSDSVEMVDEDPMEDETDELISEEPMPQAAEEFFDDFFFNFASNKRLQKERVSFPLLVYSNAKTDTLERKDWHTDHFFMHQEEYTLIFDSEEQMNQVKDVPVEEVVVEKIFLSQAFVHQYVFRKKNGQWRPETVNAMLKNEKYAGDVIFQKTWTDERFNRHINHGEMDQYVVRAHHEPIIAREDFEAVQALMDQRFGEKGGERGTDKYGQRYAFSGKIICGECGSTFRRKIQKRAGQNYIIWSCHRHIEDKDRCRMKAVTQETVETAFMTMMNKLAFAKEEMLRPLLEEIGSFDRTEGVGRINELEQKIEENVRRREHLRSMLTQGLLDADIFNSENNLLLAETDQAETELSDLKAGIREQLTIIAELEKLIKHLGSGQMMTVFDEHIFTEYADHIVVRSRSCIEIVLKCGLHLKEAI